MNDSSTASHYFDVNVKLLVTERFARSWSRGEPVFNAYEIYMDGCV